jgi:hypothetical protein
VQDVSCGSSIDGYRIDIGLIIEVGVDLGEEFRINFSSIRIINPTFRMTSIIRLKRITISKLKEGLDFFEAES